MSGEADAGGVLSGERLIRAWGLLLVLSPRYPLPGHHWEGCRGRAAERDPCLRKGDVQPARLTSPSLRTQPLVPLRIPAFELVILA